MPQLGNKPNPLLANQVSTRIDPLQLPFKSSAELQAYNGVLGQERAENAIRFGVGMDRIGYNIYAMGENGTGRSSYIREYLKEQAATKPAPSDWCYVNHFANPREPKVLELPPTKALAFKTILDDLINNLLATFPAVFEHPSYQQQKSTIDHAFNRKYDKALELVEKEALKANTAVFRDSSAISFTPMKDGKALDETEFAQLAESERETFHHNIAALEQFLNESLSELPQWKRESTNELRTLNKDTINQALSPLLETIEEGYKDFPTVLEFLATMREHLPKIILEELIDERTNENRDEFVKRTILEEILQPNIAVCHDDSEGVPVIYEPHPSYGNLFGRIEFSSDQGALTTNYRKISPGALHKANGGYLILDAEKLLGEPMVWDALKRAIKSQQLKMESPYSELGLVSTTTLLPGVIPLDIKLVLIGSRNVYYLLQEYDADFKELFRTLVDFDSEIPRTDEHIHAFARLLKSRIDEQEYADISNVGIARLIEHSSRLAEDQKYLTASIGHIFELLAEAEFMRKMDSAPLIETCHIDQALTAKEERTGRIYDRIHQQMLDNVILIESEGEAIGKVNGLTVMTVGDTRFGTPARISATVYPGSGGIVDIEREANLGQAIHSKGVMILSGYLGHKYAQDFPLAISANLAMEQSYGYIDGDSASLGELCCLISALIHQPLKQTFAITGSINQYGEVQAIGGVNEKIEGFFRLCKARGLNGEHGVIIPFANIRNLALKQEVVDAVESGTFFIYGIKKVDEALELLMDRDVGETCLEHYFSKGSINFEVINRLKQIADVSNKKSKEKSGKKKIKDQKTEK
ncbi:MAG: ATP-dependent protease [Oleispira sp.]|jgi:predicted ATP-dependent protease|nr:ATP-dependent protease [Oleispira sp.]|tara:strand:- start:3682 stop:6123 length:2442 start_codon:yes stop_codon:yes gene_type:complete